MTPQLKPENWNIGLKALTFIARVLIVLGTITLFLTAILTDNEDWLWG